jgi:hypothetical protein
MADAVLNVITETWDYLSYTAGRRYDGYAHGVVDGHSVCWPINSKLLRRYAGATVFEHAVRDEDCILDDVFAASIAEPMTLDQRVAFWSARGTRIGKVRLDGSVEWS